MFKNHPLTRGTARAAAGLALAVVTAGALSVAPPAPGRSRTDRRPHHRHPDHGSPRGGYPRRWTGLHGLDPGQRRQGTRHPAAGRPCVLARGGHPDARDRRLQLAGQCRLGLVVEPGHEVRLREGHRRHHLPQPLLRPAVQRFLQRRDDAGVLPLRPARQLLGNGPGRLVRRPRGRLVGRRQDPAGRARHRVQPLRRDLLRPQPGVHAQLDRRLHVPLQGPDRPGRDHLLDHRAGGPPARATPASSRRATPCGSPATTPPRAPCPPAGPTTRSGSTPTPRWTRTTSTATSPGSAALALG